MTRPRLELKSEPDGFGFLYGQLLATDGEAHRVDILPSASQRRGDIRPSSELPHATDWIVYLDGNEIARVRRSEDLEQAVLISLAPPA